PVFQVMFILQNAPGSALELGDVTLTTLDADNKTAKFDLGLLMREEAEDCLSGTLEYNTDLFDASTVRPLAGHFTTLLESIVESPLRRVDDLPLLSSAERGRTLEDWNRTELDYEREALLHQLFSRQAALSPAAVAVEFEGQCLTYAELDA